MSKLNLTTNERIKCEAIYNKIKLGFITLDAAKVKYNLTDEMCDYIETLFNPN